jgi:hypothetical protein
MIGRKSADMINYREELSDQRALADEIGNAIATGPQTGEQIDEGELEDELAGMEQEALDNQLLKTGTVPVLPSGPNTESEFCTRRGDITRLDSGPSATRIRLRRVCVADV